MTEGGGSAGIWLPSLVVSSIARVRLEAEGNAVHAVAQTGRLRTVVEDVAEMRPAYGALRFDAHHAMAAISLFLDRVAGNRRGEAGPAGARIELRFGSEERRPTCDAAVEPGVLFVPIWAGEGPLGAGLASNPILLGRELGAPFCVALDDLLGLRGHCLLRFRSRV